MLLWKCPFFQNISVAQKLERPNICIALSLDNNNGGLV
jgi:hypothetical protein